MGRLWGIVECRCEGRLIAMERELAGLWAKVTADSHRVEMLLERQRPVVVAARVETEEEREARLSEESREPTEAERAAWGVGWLNE